MTWALILLGLILVTLILIFLRLDSILPKIWDVIRVASDLNLEAHQRLLDHFQRLEQESDRRERDRKRESDEW